MWWFFLCILFLLELFLVWKGVMCMFEKRVSFEGMLFNVIIKVISSLVLKGVMGVFGGWVKMCEFCGYAFWNLKVYKRKNTPGSSISHYSQHWIILNVVKSVYLTFINNLKTIRNFWSSMTVYLKGSCKQEL